MAVSFRNHGRRKTMALKLNALNWDDVKVFLAIARAGTIRGAAKTIGANHATISRRLTTLESALGARLFDRATDGLTLTQLGEELVPHATKVEQELAAATRQVVGRDTRPAGVIHVSMPTFLNNTAVMEALTAFTNTYETIELFIDMTNQFVSLERREADVSIRYSFDVTQDVIASKLVQCTKGAYCSPSYAAKMADNGGAGLHWIGWAEPQDDRTADWIKEGAFPRATLRHRATDSEAQCAFAAAGEGLALLPCFVADNDPRLVRAPFQQPLPDRAIWLLVHRDLQKSARIRLFLDFVASYVRGRRDIFTVESF